MRVNVSLGLGMVMPHLIKMCADLVVSGTATYDEHAAATTTVKLY